MNHWVKPPPPRMFCHRVSPVRGFPVWNLLPAWHFRVPQMLLPVRWTNPCFEPFKSQHMICDFGGSRSNNHHDHVFGLAPFSHSSCSSIPIGYCRRYRFLRRSTFPTMSSAKWCFIRVSNRATPGLTKLHPKRDHRQSHGRETNGEAKCVTRCVPSTMWSGWQN